MSGHGGEAPPGTGSRQIIIQARVYILRPLACRVFLEDPANDRSRGRIYLTVVGEYVDKALTGRSDKRPDFQRMLRDCERGVFQAVICWKMDRFARNRYDSAMYKYKLKRT